MTDDGRILHKLIQRMKQRENDPLRPKIDKYLLQRDAAETRLQEYVVDLRHQPRPPGRFSPSDMGGCLRKAAFTFVSMPRRRKIDPDGQMIFMTGDWMHHMLQCMFLDMEQVLGPEEFKVVGIEQQVMVPDLYIAGTLDAELKIDQEPVVWDGKTINDRGYRYVHTEGKPHAKHKSQVLTYLRARKRIKGIVTYFNKDNQLMQNYSINFNRKDWEEIEGWVREIIVAMNGEKLPPMHPDCQQGNFVYERCPYARICYGNKTPKQIRIRMYKQFPGVDEQWRRFVESEDRD